MKKILVFILIIVINFLFMSIVSLFLGSGNVLDNIIVKTIPQYPNSQNWQAGASSGSPNGGPHGGIEFKTEDKSPQVFGYYEKDLSQKGWELDRSLYQDDTGGNKLRLKKKIGGISFQIYMNKVDMTEEQKKEYLSSAACKSGMCSDTDRKVLMFITHKKD